MSRPSIVIDSRGFHERTLRLFADMRTPDEDVVGSYFMVVGFAPERPGDVIPQQSDFVSTVSFFITAAKTSVSTGGRVSMMEKLFAFVLRPSYALFHWRYDGWRQTMNAKCIEYCADFRSTKRLKALCQRFMRLFPEPVDEDPS